MSDLEEKLEKIVRDGQPIALAVEDIVAEIKQAFVDAGWVTVDKRRYRDEYGREYMQYTLPNEYFRVPQFSFITGQEFYSAYKRELGLGSLDDVRDMARGDELKAIEVAEMKCDEAAKRAAGLEPGL